MIRGPEHVSGPHFFMPEKSLKQVLKERAGELMEVPGVVGVGESLCDGEPCIRVMVVARTPELEQRIPGRLEGYRVSIRVSGEFRASGAEDAS